MNNSSYSLDNMATLRAQSHTYSSAQSGSKLASVVSCDPGKEGKDGSTQEKNKTQLEDQITNDKLVRLQQIFKEADEDCGGGLDMDEFRKAMRQTLGDDIEDEELDMIFMKVDTNCDETVDWDEYLTYMLLECMEKDLMQVEAKQPFPRNAKVVKSVNKDSLIRIIFLPNLVHGNEKKQQSYKLDLSHGRYVTVSKEGIVTFWSNDLTSSVIRKIDPVPPQKSIWITDIAVMPRANMLVAATTNRTLLIFNIGSSRFERLCTISDFRACILTINYWSHPLRDSNMVLTFGDDQGGIAMIKFKECPSKTAFNTIRLKSKKIKFSFSELLQGQVKHVEAFYKADVHGDFVEQLLYTPNIDCVISCSKDTSTAMFVGTIDRQIISSYFVVEKGITTLDYSDKINVIVTGGYDAVVKVWNPYYTNKPVILLYGHKSPIIHVLINQVKEHVISIAENREVRVHDMSTQVCIQTFYRKMIPFSGTRSIAAALFNPGQAALLLSTTELALIQQRQTETRKFSSHTDRITAVLYNPLFHQLVSAGVESLVCVWNIYTGEKVMQFRAYEERCHAQTQYVEVTAMSFDPTFRRLITGSRQGITKVWNFNNGACLRVLPSVGSREVTSIICPKDHIATAGWDKKVSIFVDRTDDETMKDLQPHQTEDILTLSHYPPNLIAAGSQNGIILVWSMDTKRLVFFTRVGGSGRAQSFHTLRNLIADLKGSETSDIPWIMSDEEEDGEGSQASEQDDVTSSIAIEKLVFLPKRPNNKNTAILFAGCADGYIRAYSVHHEGGLKAEFEATRNKGNQITSMVASENNELLIIGDSNGYIRIWDISHYHITGKKCSPRTHDERLPYWREFPFTQIFMKSSTAMRGRFNSKGGLGILQTEPSSPHLINSFQAHSESILYLDFAIVNNKDMIVSCSSDCSIRLWTIKGEFLGIFGEPTVWAYSTDAGHAQKEQAKPKYLLPPDVRLTASSTTLKVFRGGRHAAWKLAHNIMSWLGKAECRIESESSEEEEDVIPEEPLTLQSQWIEKKTVLGKSYKRQTKHRPLPPIGERYTMPNDVCTAYKMLPCAEVNDISLDAVCDTSELKRIQKTHKLTPLGQHTPPRSRQIRWGSRKSNAFVMDSKFTRHDNDTSKTHVRDARRKSVAKRRKSVFVKRDEQSGSLIEPEDLAKIPNATSSIDSRRFSEDSESLITSRHSCFAGDMGSSDALSTLSMRRRIQLLDAIDELEK